MGKEELIQYFEDAIALETAVITQENFISQFEAMSKNKKPVLVERKVQVEKPDPREFDCVINFFALSGSVFTIGFLYVQSQVYDLTPTKMMAVIDGILLAIYLLIKRKWKK